MSTEQSTAHVIAQTAFMNCRVAGMVAENMQRAATGQSMAYTDADFAGVEAEFHPILIAPWIDWKAECERKDTQIVVLRQFLKRCLHYIPENDLFRDRILSQINPPENPPDEPPMVQSDLATLKGEGAGS